MPSSSSRIVAVFGATGRQGSSVVEALLADGTFAPRAITRNPDSETALKLKERGVEVVKGDNGDKASLVAALQGCEAVFGVTVPHIPPFRNAGQSELIQGKNMVDAAKEAHVEFFIFSSLPGLKKLSGGKYSGSIFDDKADTEEYLKASGLANATIHLGAFFETHHTLTKTSSGFDLAHFGPDTPQPFTWIKHDVGESVLAILKNYTDPSKGVSGKTYQVVTAVMAYTALVALTAKALGVEVTFTSLPTTGIPQFDEMALRYCEYSSILPTSPVPNPDLVALGAKFSTVEQFMEDVKERYS
ncbi:hypothetical protein DFH07DRAFT_130009 [Mycena maculata]|uniref:NmrA-like domain-containing protein n=1 Tax=Mycena maculata TaxID=230809 RepID=A0AAD7I3B2_9AGAR|nr:hypothetical protein DFH07DRAFT_130009 [Mycena maculata]